MRLTCAIRIFFPAKPAFSCSFAYFYGGLEGSIVIGSLDLSWVMLLSTVNIMGVLGALFL